MTPHNIGHDPNLEIGEEAEVILNDIELISRNIHSRHSQSGRSTELNLQPKNASSTSGAFKTGDPDFNQNFQPNFEMIK